MHRTPDAGEIDGAHIHALHILLAMGWKYVSPGEAFERRGSTGEVMLKDVLIEELRKRTFSRKGEKRPLSTNAIDHITRTLGNPGMHEGLPAASRRIYDTLTSGVTTPEFVGGKTHRLTVPIIDWENVSKNRFHVTERFRVRVSDGSRSRHPDIVCFVNGIPMAVIDAGRSDIHNPGRDRIARGISRQIRNQGNEEIPLLYAYAQLLFSVDGLDGRYGTMGTRAALWGRWREENFDETLFARFKNEPLSDVVMNRLLAEREPGEREYFEELWSTPRAPVERDRLLISLLKPERFLEFVRFFILYDWKAGKAAARYPQYRAVRRLTERLRRIDPGGARRGGVIHHAAGSGKSFTMAFLCKTLLLHDDLKGCRVIVVTDRGDLEKRLAGVFLSAGVIDGEPAGGKKGRGALVRTGKELAERIGEGSERILFSMIRKFNTAIGLPGRRDAGPDVIVIFDDARLGAGDGMEARMRRSLPRAARVMFTGTPMRGEDKASEKFGPMVHAYTVRNAVDDGVTAPLFYEKRRPTPEMGDSAVDHWFENAVRGLTEEEIADLKRRRDRREAPGESQRRVDKIALDVSIHFSRYIKSRGAGLKGQLVVDSKKAAIRYKKRLDRIGLVSSVVVISPPGVREGIEEEDGGDPPEVLEWHRENIAGRREAEYIRFAVSRFGADGGPDILIVVDKLLTDLDEPRNTVLYIDRELDPRTLIRAVARVNRLHEARRLGLLVDYRGTLGKLDVSITSRRDPETRTRAGYDIDDVDGLFVPVSEEYERLPMLRDRMLSALGDAGSKRDPARCRELLLPKWRVDRGGGTRNVHRKTREDFHEAFAEFSACLDLALGARSFFEDGSFSREEIRSYREDHVFFMALFRASGGNETSFDGYDGEASGFIDPRVEGDEARVSPAVYGPAGLKNEEPLETWSEDNIKEEADLTRARVARAIEHDFRDDPYARKIFSELLDRAVKKADAMVDRPLDRCLLFRELGEKVEKREVALIPTALLHNRKARAWYGLFLLARGEDAFERMEASERQTYIDKAFFIDRVVNAAEAAHTLNPRNVEAEIRKKLLPDLFQLLDIEMAREVIEQVVRIRRTGGDSVSY